MRPGLVVLALATAGLLTACDAPNLSGPNDSSGLQLRLSVVKSHSDDKNQPWSFSQDDPCNTNQISGTGLAEYRLDTSLDTNGAFNYNSDIHGVGTGTGDQSHKSYKVDLHSTSVIKVPPQPSPAYSEKDQDTWTIQGPTSKDNYKQVNTFQLVVDSHGNITTYIQTSTFQCG